jgi:hypothetical protein
VLSAVFNPWGGEHLLFNKYVVLTFANHPTATLHTHPRTAKRLASWSNGRFVVPTEPVS